MRVYPCKNSDFYDCFLTQKQNQQTVYQILFSDIFMSFKDVQIDKGELIQVENLLSPVPQSKLESGYKSHKTQIN